MTKHEKGTKREKGTTAPFDCRMVTATVLFPAFYKAKRGREVKTFDAREWLAAMCSHIANRGEQMVRYYGYYSNVCRGHRQKEKIDATIPCIIESDATSPAKCKAWARLIQKIYEVDPLTCPQCKGAMKIISVIERNDV